MKFILLSLGALLLLAAPGKTVPGRRRVWIDPGFNNPMADVDPLYSNPTYYSSMEIDGLPTESSAETTTTTTTITTSTATTTTGSTPYPVFRREYFDLRALNEQNTILVGKLEAVQSEVSRLRKIESDIICPLKEIK